MAVQRVMGAGIELTPQQRHVLGLVAIGYSTDEIATRLRISARTAQWHVSRLMSIFDVPNRAALVYAAASAHLLPLVAPARDLNVRHKIARGS